MNRKIIILGAFICSSGLFAAQQEQPKPEQVSQAEQKAHKQEEVLEGTLSIIGSISSVGRERQPLFNTVHDSLVAHYGELDDNEPLIGVEYSSAECADWAHQLHPKIAPEKVCHWVLRQALLPALKPIAYIAKREKIQQAIAAAWLLPSGVSALISEYSAGKISLLDATHGLQIELELPTNRLHSDKTYKALLTCRGYQSNYDGRIRLSLISAHSIGQIVLDQSLLTRIEAELAEREKKAAEEFEKWKREGHS